jgi:hypothetical protein
MTDIPQKKFGFLPVVGLFIAVSSIVKLADNWLVARGFDVFVLQSGNLFLFLVFMAATWLQRSGMQQPSTQLFLRNAYGGMMLKLFGCALGALLYIYFNRNAINKPALFGCMLLYVLYTVVELRIVLKKTSTS